MPDKERIFISGAAGVIGTEMLAKLGSHREILVFAADKKSQPQDLAPNIEYWQGDLNQITLRELSQFAPTIFIHLAATFERSTESLDFWTDNFENNIRLSHYLMGLMKQIPSLKRVIFASSYLIYDENAYQFKSPQAKPQRLSEVAEIHPRNMVGMAKLTHEKELDFLNQFYSASFSSLSVRIFRGYGRGSRDVISRWVRSLLVGEEISVYNAEGVFDYIYAKDSAEGLLKMALKSSMTGVVNLGTGQSRRVVDVIDELKTYFPDMKVKMLESNPPFEASEADITKLTSEIHWAPEYNLKKALNEIIDYERSRPKRGLQIKAPNLLVTSSSKKTPLIRALQQAGRNLDGEIKVIAGDISRNVVSRFVADSFWEMPSLKESNVEEIIRYCHKAMIKLIIPTRDGELEYWAKNENQFSDNGISVLISSLETVRICLDKLAFYEFAIEHGFKAIPSTCNSEFLSDESLYVVKERYGAGSKSIGISLTYEEALKHSSALEEPMFQPLVVGREISADVWIIPGYYESVVLRYRTLVVDGESQITQIFREAAIEELLLNFVRKLKIIGVAVIQAILDDFGDLHIIECNPRIGGASTASNAAGSRAFTKMIQYYLLGENDGHMGKTQRIQELVQIRTAIDEYSYDIDI
jgi:carbamoyl-phosphate synthase large subunit